MYVATVTAEIPIEQSAGTNWSVTTTYMTLTVEDPCEQATMTIAPSMAAQLSITYQVGTGPTTLYIYDSDVTLTPAPVITCPDIVFWVTKDLNTSIFAGAFTFNYAPQELVVNSADPSHAGSYGMKLIANFDGMGLPVDSLDFTVTITDPCSAVSLTIAASLSTTLGITYEVGSTAQTFPVNDSDVTLSPTPSVTCPGIAFSMLTSADGSIDSNIFAFDAVTQIFTVDSSDPTDAGTYQMKLIA